MTILVKIEVPENENHGVLVTEQVQIVEGSWIDSTEIKVLPGENIHIAIHKSKRFSVTEFIP